MAGITIVIADNGFGRPYGFQHFVVQGLDIVVIDPQSRDTDVIGNAGVLRQVSVFNIEFDQCLDVLGDKGDRHDDDVLAVPARLTNGLIGRWLEQSIVTMKRQSIVGSEVLSIDIELVSSVDVLRNRLLGSLFIFLNS